MRHILDIEEDLLWLRFSAAFSRRFDVHCVVDAVTADHCTLFYHGQPGKKPACMITYLMPNVTNGTLKTGAEIIYASDKR